MSNKHQQKLFLIGIFLTGATGLIYQIVWQKYLSLLIGAESRSQVLIVAFFLTGLAVGNFYFGNKSEQIQSKKSILKLYGYIEMFIGIYGLLFPKFFNLFYNSSIFEQSHFIIDFMITALLILPPTFCMGSTIPLLTKSLPMSLDQVNKTHSKIYGLNTLGAFLGTILGGVYFIYQYGLPLTSTIAASINVIVGIIFIGNSFEGNIDNKSIIPLIEHPFSKSFLKVLVFFSGLYIISLEVLWFRLLALSIGSSNLVFPMILSLFVMGLGIGTLTIKEMSSKAFKKNIIYILILQLALYLIIPYLPIWFNHLRIILKNYPQNFYVYYSLIFLFLSFILVPPLFFTGRLLPFAYAFFEKKKNDYGKQCGQLYFINTVGTFLGAVFIGHLLLWWLNIHTIYQILTISMIIIICYMLYIDRLKKIVAITLVCSIGVLIIGRWNRTHYILGVFRQRNITKDHYNGLFWLPPEQDMFKKIVYYQDGVNTTVAGLKSRYKEDGKNEKYSYSLVVNGKSDGDTEGDFGTIHLLGLIPYLYHQGSNLKVAVVGMGTGVTAGLMGSLKDVSQVDVVEISPSVKECIDHFGSSNYNVINNPKVKVHLMDAFKFFRGKKEYYDIIVSEPTNPWTAGTEQLFTAEFFQAVKKGLKSNGFFIQWTQLYDFSKKNFTTILKNLRDVSYNTQLYLTQGMVDTIFVSSLKELSSFKFNKSRFKEKIVSQTTDKLGIFTEEMFFFLKYFNNQELKIIERLNMNVLHSIEFPRLGLEALKSFFVGNQLDLNLLISPYLGRHIKISHKRYQLFVEAINVLKAYNKRCQQNLNIKISCTRGNFLYEAYMNYRHEGRRVKDVLKRISGYEILRKHQYINKDKQLIADIKQLLLSEKTKKIVLLQFINELIKEGEFNIIRQVVSKINEEKIGVSEKNNIIQDLKQRENDIQYIQAI